MSTEHDRPLLSPTVVRQILAALLQEWQALAALFVQVAAWVTRSSEQGIYEILHYDSTLELLDSSGHMALFHKRQQVRFLQDNIIAFEDYAWGAPRGAV